MSMPALAQAPCRAPLWAWCVVTAALGTSCSLITPFDVSPAEDGGPADGDAGGDAAADGDAVSVADGDAADGDADWSCDDASTGEGGQMTWVMGKLSTSTERVFDIDGDGTPDNVVADLGEGPREVFAAALSVVLGAASAEKGRSLVHLPWVDDATHLSDPDTTVIFVRSVDLDVPPDPLDDLSGEEPFYGHYMSLDPCGEPRYLLKQATLDCGRVAGRGGIFSTASNSELKLRQLQVEGNLSVTGSSSIKMGGGFLAREFGAADDFGEFDLSNLEVMLSGGAVFGMPGVPGIDPDLDLDGDGLESFDVDDEGQITKCIDGDRTVIEGRDCWRDERIQDAFSVTIDLVLERAVFVGREPGWRDFVEGECTDPPEDSLFDPP